MEQHRILHILKNPYGWPEKEIRRAALAAADEIERLQREVEALRMSQSLECVKK